MTRWDRTATEARILGKKDAQNEENDAFECQEEKVFWIPSLHHRLGSISVWLQQASAAAGHEDNYHAFSAPLSSYNTTDKDMATLTIRTAAEAKTSE